MAMPDPLNSVADLLKFTNFAHGAGNDALSVKAGSFEYSQFDYALRRARNEIYAKAGRLDNADYDEYRLEQLTEAELWLATARLYPMFGERIALRFPEANLTSVAEITQGADTPSPFEKLEVWHRVAKEVRAFGLELLRGDPWDMAVGSETTTDNPYNCLADGVYSNHATNCCQYV